MVQVGAWCASAKKPSTCLYWLFGAIRTKQRRRFKDTPATLSFGAPTCASLRSVCAQFVPGVSAGQRFTMLADVTSVRALPYFGGKSGRHSRGRWVASLLPHETDVYYVEPFAGMCGVLLQRPPSKRELINDLDDRIVNWWRVVRDNSTELEHKLRNTPHSRTEFVRALKLVDDNDPVVAAWAVTLVLLWDMQHSLGNIGSRQNSWVISYNHNESSHISGHSVADILPALKDRMRDVTLENRDAAVIVDRFGTNDGCVIYLDPPYSVANKRGYYKHDSIDVDALTEILSASTMRARCAISGYNKDWDHLGWDRHEMVTETYLLGQNSGTVSERIEVVWTNYQPQTTTIQPALWG